MISPIWSGTLKDPKMRLNIIWNIWHKETGWIFRPDVINTWIVDLDFTFIDQKQTDTIKVSKIIDQDVNYKTSFKRRL